MIAGGSGQIGTALINYFKTSVNEIVVLTRDLPGTKSNIRYVQWDGKSPGPWMGELESADVLINLTGKNVNCRYTPQNKQEILASRVHSVRILETAVNQCRTKPALWIQSASATIYRPADDRPMDEDTGEIGEGFSVDVCKAWEKEFEDATVEGVRKVLLRIGMVLSHDAGVMPRLRNLIITGLGGAQGSGKQRVSWLHERDLAGIIHWIIRHPQAEGAYNCTAPHAPTNADMMDEVRSMMGIKFRLPLPAWLLYVGAWIIGTEAELILKSRWVKPKRLLDEGYHFEFPTLKTALIQFSHDHALIPDYKNQSTR